MNDGEAISGIIHSLSVIRSGAIAQLVERLLCKQNVVGSIPSGSTSLRPKLVSVNEACPGVACVAGLHGIPEDYAWASPS